MANSVYELGTVDPGVPSSTDAETTMLLGLIQSYNTGSPASPFIITIGPHNNVATLDVGSAVPAAPLPAPGIASGNLGVGGGQQDNYVIDLGAGGFNYAMVKWGQISEFYYIGGLSGLVSLSNDVNENGESHFTLWGPGTTVPDAGATVVLLGGAMSFLGLMRRKLS
jgi:hypothetical protein